MRHVTSPSGHSSVTVLTVEQLEERQVLSVSTLSSLTLPPQARAPDVMAAHVATPSKPIVEIYILSKEPASDVHSVPQPNAHAAAKVDAADVKTSNTGRTDGNGKTTLNVSISVTVTRQDRQPTVTKADPPADNAVKSDAEEPPEYDSPTAASPRVLKGATSSSSNPTPVTSAAQLAAVEPVNVGFSTVVLPADASGRVSSALESSGRIVSGSIFAQEPGAASPITRLTVWLHSTVSTQLLQQEAAKDDISAQDQQTDAPNVIPGTPIELGELRQALDEFIHQAEAVVSTFAGWLGQVGPVPWVVLGLSLALTVHELARAQRRQAERLFRTESWA